MMNTADLEKAYLLWLYSRTGNVEETRPSLTYWKLFQQLRDTEFVWFVHNDDNRVEDGRELRRYFLDDIRVSEDDVDQRWFHRSCSVLEMLIGLAIRIEFDAEFTVAKWFWEMLSNSGLSGYVDWRYDARAVEDIVQRILWRTYNHDGDGGLFPLRHPELDQRHVELWYQAQAYLQEQH